MKKRDCTIYDELRLFCICKKSMFSQDGAHFSWQGEAVVFLGIPNQIMTILFQSLAISLKYSKCFIFHNVKTSGNL